MNRHTILLSIDRHLRENLAKTGEERPLGEIVPLVAAELRQRSNGSPVNPSVVPIEQVAAFIDGQLTDHEVQSVCDAVLVDNSVLAELIAGVRAAGQVQTLAPISAALTDRLLAMQSQPSATSAVDAAAKAGSEAGDSAALISIPSTSLGTQPRRTKRSRTTTVVAILAIAATLLALIFVMSRRQPRTPQGSEVVEHDRVSPGVVSDVPDVDPPLSPEPGDEERAMAIDETRPDPKINSDLDPMPPKLDLETVVRDEIPEESLNPEPMDVVPKIPLDASPPADSEPAVARLADLRWTAITGLLTELNQADGSTGPARAPIWKSVQADTSPADDSPAKDNVALRTLPLSRAEATLASGGRIVLAGDSGMQVTRTGTTASAAIELHHGSVAMMDLSEGTVIDMRMGNRIVATLRWQDKASAVLQRVAAGLQVHIDRGTIVVNNQPHTEDSLVVAPDQSVASINKPKRIPAWVDRPVENVSLPRPILAQLSESNDVSATLGQRISALASQPNLSASDARTLTALANWQAAMAGANLLRLGNSRHAVMRMAALSRLVNLSADDPRYGRVWTAIERTVGNPQRAARMRLWCAMARGGVRPNAAQVEQILGGLSAQDVSGRALCDLLLRTFYGGGPPFDPTWTGQAQTRGVSLWRTYTGRTSVRGANQANPAAVRDVP